ncbi:MAG: DNA polymerase III subunit delta, partial [Beijerinckiaceae bacterium]
MAEIPPAQVEAFLRKPDPDIALILIYGADHGLVVERAGKIAKIVTGGSDDPMQVLRMDGEAVASD